MSQREVRGAGLMPTPRTCLTGWILEVEGKAEEADEPLRSDLNP